MEEDMSYLYDFIDSQDPQANEKQKMVDDGLKRAVQLKRMQGLGQVVVDMNANFDENKTKNDLERKLESSNEGISQAEKKEALNLLNQNNDILTDDDYDLYKDLVQFGNVQVDFKPEFYDEESSEDCEKEDEILNLVSGNSVNSSSSSYRYTSSSSYPSTYCCTVNPTTTGNQQVYKVVDFERYGKKDIDFKDFVNSQPSRVFLVCIIRYKL